MKKTKKDIKSLVFIAVTVILGGLAIAFSGYVWGPGSIFYDWMNSISNNVLKEIVGKIPAFITSGLIILAATSIIKIIKIVFKVAFKKNKKMVTIMSLMASLFKWIIIIISALLILKAFGVDTTTLLASAGILTLVIGFGAQSLVADILAGFFLVFEGEYEVGDIISVDGWRGTVRDIGIRVTRIEDVGGNIKTINNSDVKNVINQTHELSVAKVTMPIDYGESLERVEIVLKDNFDKIAKNIPDIVEGPYYKGVSSLGSSSVDLLIIAKCNESNIYQVQRDLIRELYIVFNKNGITVPFQQVVLSQRESENSDASKKMEKIAKDFLEDQKESSKNIGEGNE